MDALTRAGVYRDDAQVVDWFGRKRFAGGLGDPPGARHHGLPRAVITVAPLVLPAAAPAEARQLPLRG